MWEIPSAMGLKKVEFLMMKDLDFRSPVAKVDRLGQQDKSPSMPHRQNKKFFQKEYYRL